MLHFHANIFARPSTTALGAIVQLRSEQFATLVATEGGPPKFDLPLPLDFEQIQERLLAIPRMDVEPDGYFLVAGGESEGERWQIDGHLFEYNGLMHRVELHGSCSQETLEQLLDCCGTRDVVFQLVHEGATLSSTDFHRFAALPPSR